MPKCTSCGIERRDLAKPCAVCGALGEPSAAAGATPPSRTSGDLAIQNGVKRIGNPTARRTVRKNGSALGVLFDLSFAEFVTTSMVKLFFIIGIIWSTILTLVLIVLGFKVGASKGVLALLLSPIVFLISVLCARIWCEMIIVVFRIAENTSRLVEQGKQG